MGAAGSRLAGPDRQHVRHRPATQLGHVLDGQPGADETVQQVGQRVVPHPDPLAHVLAPVRRLRVPPGLAVGGVHAHAAVVQPFDMRPVETRVHAAEHQQPARRQHPRRLGHHGREVIDVGRRPHRGDGRERAVGERQGGGITLDDPPGPGPRVAQLVGREVQPDHRPPGGGQRAEVVPAAAAQVQAQAVTGAQQVHDLGGVPLGAGQVPALIPVAVTVVACSGSHRDSARAIC